MFAQARILSFFVVVAAVLSGCDIKSNLPDLEYPESAAYENEIWPELAPTAQLIGKKSSVTDAEKSSLLGLAARAQSLRARSAQLRASSISTSRINRLQSRAAALRAAKI